MRIIKDKLQVNEQIYTLEDLEKQETINSKRGRGKEASFNEEYYDKKQDPRGKPKLKEGKTNTWKKTNTSCLERFRKNHGIANSPDLRHIFLGKGVQE